MLLPSPSALSPLAHPEAPAERSAADPVVCHCHGVRESTLRAAIRAHRAVSVSDLTARTCAGTGCTACVRRLQRLLEGPSASSPHPCAFCTQCRSIAALCRCEDGQRVRR